MATSKWVISLDQPFYPWVGEHDTLEAAQEEYDRVVRELARDYEASGADAPKVKVYLSAVIDSHESRSWIQY